MNLIRILRLLAGFWLTQTILGQATLNVRDLILSRTELTTFASLLTKLGIIEVLADGTYTVFAPSNDAIAASPQFQNYLEDIDQWNNWLTDACYNFIVNGQALTAAQIFNAQVTEIQTMTEAIQVSQFLSLIGGARIDVPDLQATNGYVQIVDKVINPSFFDKSFRDLESISEYGPDYVYDPPRVSLVTVVDHLGARSLLDRTSPTGQTFIGCRIRAFNRMGLDYLTQTINGSPNVTDGELLNNSFIEQSTANFIEYSLLPFNVLYDAIPEKYQELVFPENDCAHMWITKNSGILCFNDGCLTQVNGVWRTFRRSNGQAHVIDKCQLCPGVAMLVGYAADYTNYALRNTAQFFVASEWNLRNLSLSVGDGDNVTLFASTDPGWSIFNLEDTIRLASDKWKPHQLNLLSHFMVQGKWTEQDFIDKFNIEKGAYNMTSLAGEPIEISYNQTRSVVTIAGFDLFYKNIKGVDGLTHFTTGLPLPKSVTHTVYDIADELPQFATQIILIDSVFLRADMRRLLPLTAMYAPNQAWQNKVIKLNQLASTVLENMLFEDLMWCHSLIAMAGNNEKAKSLNGQTWQVSVNSEGFPCFETVQAFGQASLKACITKCDILARNGIVHELDNVLFFETPETKAPSPPTPTAPIPPRSPSAPIWQVVNGATDAQPSTVGAPSVNARPTSSNNSSSYSISLALTLYTAIAVVCALVL